VELLPVAHFLDEPDLRARGLVNYWGYNPIAFFAPHARYAATWGGQVGEFRAMTHALHEAGLEVIVDVVFNHTAEGNEHGPTLCLRGLDNRAYYRLPRSSQAGYSNYTGTGNSLDTRYPAGLRLVLDALRYWVTVLGVDGFRFDLAPVLARSPRRFEPNAAFLQAAFADPVLRQVKLIAEPWDASDGYALGRFPRGWAEWNDKFRDGVRRFWLTGCELRELGFRLSGSSDVFGGKAPDSSVNYVTCHDGSPLRDLVSYVDKHNEANGYGNSDGMNGEVRVNLGVEGDDEDLLPVRRSLARAMLATLLLTPGVPMLLAGDERWRTQRGNNNAFCQDNEVSWVDWAVDPGGLPELVRRLLALRRRMPSVRAHRFYTGQPVDPDAAVPDLAWFRPDGRQMAPADWSSQSRTLGAYFDGRGRRLGPRGERLSGDSWLLLLHAGDEPCWFTLPGRPYAGKYHVELDTNTPTGEPIGADPVPAGTTYVIPPRCVAALRAG
jgi:glycogen operon protein